jgi:hypothetical protein
MSVNTQIKNDWAIAIKKSLPTKIIDRTNMIRIAIDSIGNEYFIQDNKSDDKTFRVIRPDGINAKVWKKGFKLRWVNSDYSLKPLIR